MSTEPPKTPDSPFRLNPARIMILLMGALVLVYLVSGLFGGLANYQQLKEASQDKAGEQHDPAENTGESPGL